MQIGRSAQKYFHRLDRPTQKRMRKKLADILREPFAVLHSKPLSSSDKRSARVGCYRILFIVIDMVVLITDIDARGDVYKET